MSQQKRRKHRKEVYFIQLARAYKKAPWAIRIQVTIFLLLILAVIAGLVIGIRALFFGGDGSEVTREQQQLAEEIKVVEDDTGQKKVVVPKYVADVNDEVKSHRELVEKYSKTYKIFKYRELILALIMQESNGQEPDVMQSEECEYNHYPPIGGADESIFCGVQELRDCIQLAKVRGPADIERIKLALQGYNYGQGYIRMRLKQGEGYSEDSAREFSEMMKNKLGWSGYGDPDYVKHVLRYYKKTKDKDESGHSDE